MTEYDESGYYEVQLNNKQLVFFFMAAVAIAVVVFLCGVMVGRGVRDATVSAAQSNITEPSSRSANEPAGTARAEHGRLDYARRLTSDDVDEGLQPPVRPLDGAVPTAGGQAKPPPLSAEAVDAKKATTSKPAPKPVAAKPKSTPPVASGKLGRESGAFTIQVVALKTPASAQSLLERLQKKNYRAYVEDGGDAGLHRVRVGWFATRDEAELIVRKLRTEEKFKPYITQE